MKRKRISRRNRYKKLLSRLRPGKQLFVVDLDEALADLDPGLLAWRARR